MTIPGDKKLTDSQLLGSQGTSLIDLIVSRMGFVWRPTAQHDAGIDGEIEVREPATGRMTGLLVKVQSRAVSAFANETDESFDYWPEERDMRYWLGHNLPVILVVSQPATGNVYWLSVREQISSANSKRFHFVKARDRLDEGARGRLIQLAQSAGPRAIAPALAKPEELTCNLLPVVRLPERLYLAETTFRSGKEIGELLKQMNQRGATETKPDARTARPDLRVEFVLKNKRILTVRDLTDPRYEFLCDRGTVEDFPSSEWALAADLEKQRDFVHLLNQCLREMLRGMPEHLWFDRDARCFFFPPSRDRKPYDYAYRGAKKETAREVFKERINKRKGHVMGYRHSAMMAQFYRYDTSWYLEVTPTYFFTKDGAQKSKWHEEWLKGIKELVDADAERPRRIRLGLVGTQQTVDGIVQWLERCCSGVAAKASRQPNLFPAFPGFGAESVFKTEFDIDQSLVRALPSREVARIAALSHYTALAEAEQVLEGEVQAISEKARPDVVIVALPGELIALEDEEEVEATAEFASERDQLDYETNIDLRHMLKAKVMRFNQPIQLVLPQTYDERAKGKTSKKSGKRRLQDEATRAWNFHTALCYKANHRLWRIVRNASDLHTCFVGISFYRSLDQANLMTSMAQVYDERGEGVIVRGKAVELSKDDRQPHLSKDDACMLLASALSEYRREHKHPPARVVLHKSSTYNQSELNGFNAAVDSQGLDSADFLVVSKSFTRLFRDGRYPPLRGTMLTLDDRTHLLYTRGSVPYYATYPGMYVPRPLKFQMTQADGSARQAAEELLALTKLNWNNTQFDGGLPITMRVAQEVGKVLKYVPERGVVQPRYSFYM